MLVLESGERIGSGLDEAVAQFDELIRRGRSQLLALDDAREGLCRVVRAAALSSCTARSAPPGHCAAARSFSGGTRSWPTRAASSPPPSASSADELIVEWPQEALAQGSQTTNRDRGHHADDKFDEPALIGALETEAFYIGALGSRRNQERRRERLLEAGVGGRLLERIMGATVSASGPTRRRRRSILAEILAVRGQRAGGFLKDAKKRIHVEVE